MLITYIDQSRKVTRLSISISKGEQIGHNCRIPAHPAKSLNKHTDVEVVAINDFYTYYRSSTTAVCGPWY